MNIDTITAKVRPRLGWEALDLGFRMVHQHGYSLWTIWFGLTLPIYLLLVLLFKNETVWIIFFLWWLKPIFESTLLNYISRALFGEYPSLKQSLKTFHKYAFKQWIPTLLWRRLSLTRSMDHAVAQLENLSGNMRSQRIQSLHSFNTSAAVWLTCTFVLVHFLLYLNLLLLGFWLTPEIYLIDIEDSLGELFWSNHPMFNQIQILLHYLILSFLTPFYVVGGFTIYINQRTILEAWDIELIFKKLKNKTDLWTSKKKISEVAAGKSLLLIVLVACHFFTPKPVYAEESPKAVVTHESAKQSIQKIMAKPPFENEEMRSKIEFDFGSKSENKSNDTESVQFDGLGRSLSFVLEVVLWLVIAFVVIWLLMKLSIFKTYFSFKKRRIKKGGQPEVLFGLELTPESLPDDPSKIAYQLWQKGEHRAAFSLLLRATLKELITKHNCQFENGFTELECARIVAASAYQSTSEYFQTLINHWRLFAYGHIYPSSTVIKQLCDDWPLLFTPTENNESEVAG